jgi:nucleotide-binding universal stress UspA family protein
MMYQKILVPLDGSPASESALPLAASIARQSGATLQLVHVHTLNDSIYVEDLPVIDDQLHSLRREHERVYLERLCARVKADGNLPVTCTALDWDRSVANVLIAYIAATGIDLVVMTTHGQSGWERMWLGSVADSLIRWSPTPILLVRPTAAAHELLNRSDVCHMLVPLDGSETAEQIIPHALALGAVLKAEYLLLRVITPAVYHTPDLIRHVESDAQAYLADIARRFHTLGATATTHVVIAEQPARAILDVAAQKNPCVIAIATHGHSGMQKLLLGSVADKLIRAAWLPILVCHPHVDEP